jgi:N-acetylneuraminic acid mutarotase
MYVFGGNSDPRDPMALNELWMYDPTIGTYGSWTLLSPSGTPPTVRALHTAVVIDDTMYVFGGWDSTLTLNDLWMYDPVGNDWTQLAAGANQRVGHSAWVAGNKMYVFGGDLCVGGGLLMNDLWIFNPYVLP